MAERKSRGGRPSKYNKDVMPTQAEKLCAEGFTDDQLAKFFEVSIQTLNTWKAVHPEFLEALKRGKDRFDTERVEVALAQRAIGYSHPEDDIRVVAGKIVITPTIKHYPPDTTACIFWLKNRQPKKWRDKQEHEVTGKDGGPVQVEVSRTDYAALRAALKDDGG
ncbi:terminase [Pseudothauera rhizosphaerae]|uniref:Terminase n=1 Tax=Pseudothauera rhizosphaerae TaxID=2565932 RepID=A0A4S4ABA1_9RHOO|nr:terminase [Pseudothauera rhizosphaerae]THF55928.1 terminase [Pseudothauera rhizosphaerae]